MIAALNTASKQRFVQDASCLVPPDSPRSAITIQKISARDERRHDRDRADERHRIGKRIRATAVLAITAAAPVEIVQAAAVPRRERVFAESGKQAEDCGAARIDADRVPNDHHEHEARHDRANRPSSARSFPARRQRRDKPGGGDIPRRADERRDVRLTSERRQRDRARRDRRTCFRIAV